MGEEILIYGLSDGVSTPAQRRLSNSCSLCPTLVPWEAVRQQGGNVTASQLHRLTSPRCPTVMRVQMGWKAPVPQASRWVRLWGCKTRTKLAHSVCKRKKGPPVREEGTISSGSKAQPSFILALGG